jgi:hypothetical protein
MRRRRTAASKDAEAAGRQKDAQALRLIANVELFSALADGLGLDDHQIDAMKTALASTLAVYMRRGPLEERCSAAAWLLEYADCCNKCDPLDMLAVYRHEGYKELEAEFGKSREEDGLSAEDVRRMFLLGVEAGGAEARPGDMFPAPVPTRVRLDDERRKRLMVNLRLSCFRTRGQEGAISQMGHANDQSAMHDKTAATRMW